jgi:hypothetical protein
MTTFLDYFEAMGNNLRVVVTRKWKPSPKPEVVTIRTAANIAHISIWDIVEEMRAAQAFENDEVSIGFSPLDNGPEHMPKQ